MTDTTHDPRSFIQLLADATDHFSKLLRSEIKVVRAELTEKVTEVATGLAALLLAAVLLVPTLVLLLLALASWFIELGLRASLAHLAAAGAGLIVSGALALFGKSRLSGDALKPQRTAAEIEHDTDALRRVAPGAG